MALTFATLEFSGPRSGKAVHGRRQVPSWLLRRVACGAGMLALLLLLVPAQASAELITLRFTGTVTILPLNPVPGFETVAIGDRVTGEIDFDTSVADAYPDLPWAGNYPQGVRRFDVSIGTSALSLTGGTSGMSAEDAVANPPTDFVTFGTGDPSGTFQLLAQFLSREDEIQGDMMPLDASVYMGFETRRFRILHVPDFDESPRGLAGTIDSVAIGPTPVPEPGTIFLAATGTGILLRMRRRNRQRE